MNEHKQLCVYFFFVLFSIALASLETFQSKMETQTNSISVTSQHRLDVYFFSPPFHLEMITVKLSQKESESPWTMGVSAWLFFCYISDPFIFRNLWPGVSTPSGTLTNHADERKKWLLKRFLFVVRPNKF